MGMVMNCPACGKHLELICDCTPNFMHVDWDEWRSRIDFHMTTVLKGEPGTYDTPEQRIHSAAFMASISIYLEWQKIRKRNWEEAIKQAENESLPDWMIPRQYIYFMQAISGGAIKIGISI